MEVTDKLHSTLATKHTKENLVQIEKIVLKYFDEEFIDLLSVAESKAQISHDANLFSTICQHIKNDLLNLDTCIKELQRCQQDGKVL